MALIIDKERLKLLVDSRRVVDAIEEKTEKRFPWIIDAICERDGRSLRGLAKKIGVSATYLCQVANGKQKPSPKLAELLLKEM